MIQPRLPPITGMPHSFKTNRLCNILSLICPECIAVDLKSSKSSLSWNFAAEMTEFLPSKWHMKNLNQSNQASWLAADSTALFYSDITFIYHNLFKKVNQKHKIVSSDFLPARDVPLIA